MRFSSLQCILISAEAAIVLCVMIVTMSLIQKEPARRVPKRNMKNKITWILPAVIFFLIVLTGCGKRELVLEQEQEQSRAESKEEILFGSSILQMLSEQDSTPAEESESENMSAAVDETVQKVEESAEMVGEEADSEEADISEELQTGTGNEAEVFVEDPYWPENEYTKQIPKPDFEIISARVDEIGFGTDFASTVTTKDVIAYVDVVQNSGFNIDVEIDARAYEGESRYLFLAYNKAGYFVEIYWYSSGSGMAMRK